MSAPFVKLLRGADAEKMLAEHPNCFLVLTLIALRARREVPSYNPYGLQKGEALVGDFAAAGLERQPFRTALSNLQKWGFITTRATTKGTIAKLSKSAFYDINSEAPNQQDNQPSTSEPTSDQPAANQQLTTNKNVKKDNKEKNKEEKERKDVAPTDPPSLAAQVEKPAGSPVKLWPDEAQVFLFAGFKKFVSKMGFGHINSTFYLPDIQRRAELMKQQRDEVGWENFIHEFLKREMRDGRIVPADVTDGKKAAPPKGATHDIQPTATVTSMNYDRAELARRQSIPTE